MRQIIRPGLRLPNTAFGELVDDTPVARSSHELFRGKRAVLIGAPAAFSPICSRIHIRGFVEQAHALLSSGFDMIACLSANDPWVLTTWAQTVDPKRHIRFLSDGNLEFGQACCLTTTGHDLFVGTRLKRFSMIVTDCIIERVAIEDSALEVTCTAANQFMRGDARPYA